MEFYCALWAVVVASSACRRASLIYMNKRIAMVQGPSHLVRLGLSSCFGDSSILVQRLALDVIVGRYPLHRVYGSHC
jgi:hypothetical protein